MKMFSLKSLLVLFVLNLSSVRAHTVITYPPWRGDNLMTNGTLPEHDATTIGVNNNNGSWEFPYGQQWIYPCGGMPVSQNRSLWPVNGGALALQPGWFRGHKTATFYVNIGINGPGEVAPPNMSHPVVQPFQITGPSNEAYEAAFCLPQVPMVPNVTFNIGDNVTIQVIELAQHGAAIYNCADVTLADPKDVPEVNASNCYNTTNLSFQMVFETASLTSGAMSIFTHTSSVLATLPVLMALVVLLA